ncbi:nucleotidyltransferase substrate binding protein [Kingella kingae]|nr:nucleotidyltransferase substrate binding protein [Kingella kingae]MDK4574110.1 nucleotidyltransferase substrate binding protein [Kingella kingae]MDK4606206.1 nucleotidyltransferase substrate binding protein [Kingella kingae]
MQEGWQRYLQDTSDTQIRDGLIQRFEFTYEISHKILKRYSPTPHNLI